METRKRKREEEVIEIVDLSKDPPRMVDLAEESESEPDSLDIRQEEYHKRLDTLVTNLKTVIDTIEDYRFDLDDEEWRKCIIKGLEEIQDQVHKNEYEDLRE